MKFIFLIVCIALQNHPALAKTPNENGEIACDESDAEEGSQARIYIALDASGWAEEITVKRPKTSDFDAVDWHFTKANSTIVHEVREGHVIDIDEVTKEKIYDWGIPQIETIEVHQGENSWLLEINDHTYAGWPGSAATYTVKGVAFRPGNMMSCEGALKLPNKRMEEFLEEKRKEEEERQRQEGPLTNN